MQTACIESFNGKFRDECLKEHWFLTLQEAKLVIEAWRREYEYNEERTHSVIGGVTPQEFILTIKQGPRHYRGSLSQFWCKKRGKVSPVNENWLQHGISSATYYKWKAKYGGLEATDVKRLKDLEHEHNWLKQLHADLSLENAAEGCLAKKLYGSLPGERS